MRNKAFMLIATACAAVLLSACRNDIVYSRFHPVTYTEGTMTRPGKWHIDSVQRFDYTIADATAGYRMLVYVRHTERYPYQNMWLFIDHDGKRDTIEFYLADDRGRWLGDKKHGFIEMPVLYETNYHYPDTGNYSIAVQHGMRDTLLRGVTDVGVEVVRSEGVKE